MNLTPITPEQAAGKAFRAFVKANWGPYALVVFEDGTFLQLEIDHGYERSADSTIELSAWARPLDLAESSTWDLDELIEAGVITREELSAAQAAELARKEAEAAKAKAAWEAREREQYLRLKQKFEPS